MLLEPGTHTVRYVGITSQEVAERLWGHCCRNSHNTHKERWVQKLKRSGRRPECRAVLVGMSKSEAEECERWLIEDFKNAGHPLTNILPGGDAVRPSGWKQSDEAKAKLSASLRGRKISQEWRDKISAAKLGVPRPMDAIARSAMANTGRKRSEETRRKISMALSGKAKSMEHRKNLSISRLAKRKEVLSTSA